MSSGRVTSTACWCTSTEKKKNNHQRFGGAKDRLLVNPIIMVLHSSGAFSPVLMILEVSRSCARGRSTPSPSQPGKCFYGRRPGKQVQGQDVIDTVVYASAISSRRG